MRPRSLALPLAGAYTYDWIENLLGLEMLRGIKQRAERLASAAPNRPG